MTATAASSYRIASGDTIVNLEKAVNQALAGGWQPYGPPFMTHDHRVVQAMILPLGVQAAPGARPIPTGASAVSGVAAAPPAQAAPPVQQAAPQPQQQRPAAAPAPQQAPPQQAAPQQPAPAAAGAPQQPQWGAAPAAR